MGTQRHCAALQKKKHPRFFRAGVQQISRPISGSYFVAANAAHMQLAPESSHQPQFVCCAFKQRGSSPCNYASLSISFPTSLRDFIAVPFPFSVFKYGRRSLASSARTKANHAKREYCTTGPCTCTQDACLRSD